MSHYENNCRGAVKRLNAIAAPLGSLDFTRTPILVINGRSERKLIAMNSMVLHELYFDSLRADGEPDTALREALIRDLAAWIAGADEFVVFAWRSETREVPTAFMSHARPPSRSAMPDSTRRT